MKLLVNICTLTFLSTISLAQVMVKDIYPGSNGSLPSYPNIQIQGYSISNGYLYFEAYESINGGELWKTDGTESGTALVKNIAPGALSSFVRYFADVNGTLFFSAGSDNNNNTWDYELWKSDGSDAGTMMVKDIFPGSDGSMPKDMISFNGEVYFSADDGDHGIELWKSNGTPSGTVIVKDIYAGDLYGNPKNFAVYDNYLYFQAKDNIYGEELWKTDGTLAGTTLVKNIAASSSGSYPERLTISNGQLFFVASTSANGKELWKTNGTPEGTIMVKDIWPGSGGGLLIDLNFFKDIGGTLYFIANDGNSGNELWKSDGTAAGTMLIKDIKPGSGGSWNTQSPFDGLATVADGKYFFRAEDGIHGPEIWVSDGTELGTFMLKDINPGSSGSYPAYLTVLNGIVYFQAANYSQNGGGVELYRTDGTPEGTFRVSDIHPGSSGSGAAPILVFNNQLYFSANDGMKGTELWKTDGTVTSVVESRSNNQLVAVFPNPAKEVLNITNFSQNLQCIFELYDAGGRKVMQKLISGDTQFPLGNLQPGLYSYHILSDGFIQRGKILKD